MVSLWEIESMDYIKKDVQRKQILSIVIYAVIQMTSLITPYLMGVVIDRYIPDRDMPGIIVGILLFVMIPMITILLQTVYQYFLIKYIRKKGNQIALEIMENLIYQEKRFFDQENSMELLSYCSKEAVGYLNFYLSDMSRYYVNIVMAVIIFIIMLWVSPVLGVLQLLYLPIAYFPVRGIMKNIDKEVQTIVTLNAEMNQVKGDIFKAIEFIKLARLEQKKLAEVSLRNDKVNGVWGKVAALDGLSGAWANAFASVLFKGLTFGIGAVFVISAVHTMQIGQLVAIITYGALYYANVNSILQTQINKRKKNSEYEKLFSFLNLSGERERDKDKSTFCLRRCIEFRHCNFSYDSKENVLKNMDLRLEAGQWTGLVGPSGQGKSTILDIILKLYSVEDGAVYVDDQDLNEVSCFSIRENITKIAQDIYLFPGTIEDNLRLVCPDISEEKIWEALRFACLDEYVAALPKGIRTDVGEAGKLMSGGERQRLSIAMGVLRGNKILLLDEVTSNLDVVLEEKLAEHFNELLRKGYTIISISHRMGFLKYAQNVYEIRDGESKAIREHGEKAAFSCNTQGKEV